MLYRYFRAEVNEDGEVSGDVCEVNFTEERDRIKEQIQEDVITFVESCQTIARYNEQFIKDNLCQIVVDNFKKLEK